MGAAAGTLLAATVEFLRQVFGGKGQKEFKRRQEQQIEEEDKGGRTLARQ